MSDSQAEETNQRLRVICDTQDGFEIAEADLRFRGPGELVGKRQHGLPALKAANLVEDIDLLQQARDDAADILERDPELSQPVHRALRERLRAKYEPNAQAQAVSS